MGNLVPVNLTWLANCVIISIHSDEASVNNLCGVHNFYAKLLSKLVPDSISGS